MTTPGVTLPDPPSGAAGKGRCWLIFLTAAGVLLIIIFGLRIVRSYVRLQRTHPGQGTPNIEMIRGWMTVDYIAQVYQIPEDALFEAMNIPPQGNAGRSLGELSRRYYPGQPGVLVKLVKTTISAYRIEHAPPPLPDTQFPPDTPPIPEPPALPTP